MYVSQQSGLTVVQKSSHSLFWRVVALRRVDAVGLA
jgi:hypothetical protein